jgi:Nucleotidyl transferase AbiEii toxin, Type IV TA system
MIRLAPALPASGHGGHFRKPWREGSFQAAPIALKSHLGRRSGPGRLLARLFRIDPAPRVLKSGYALELRFRTARATVDINLTVQRVAATTDADANQIVRDLLQGAPSFSLGDWFEYTIGPPVMDLDAAPYGGARFPVETRMDGRIFAHFHLDAGIGDAMIQPVEIIECRDWLSLGVWEQWNREPV